MFALALSVFLVSMPQGPSSIADKTAGMQRLEGFLDLYWEESTGKLYWEIDSFDREFLYQVSLASGLGSNPVGLDRGQLGNTVILKAVKVGPRVLLLEPNYRYRAVSDNPDEVRAVEDAFAPSVHWGFEAIGFDGHGRTGGRDRFLPSGHARSGARDGAGGAGKLPARPEPERLLHASHEELSEEHRGRGAPHLHEPEARRARGVGCGDRECGDAPRASLFRRASSGAIRASRRRSSHRGLRADVSGLREADRRERPREARGPTPLEEEGSERRAVRAGRAHHLLPGSRESPSRCGALFSTGRAGGTRPSRPRATSTPSGSRSFPKARIRRTSGTT